MAHHNWTFFITDTSSNLRLTFDSSLISIFESIVILNHTQYLLIFSLFSSYIFFQLRISRTTGICSSDCELWCVDFHKILSPSHSTSKSLPSQLGPLDEEGFGLNITGISNICVWGKFMYLVGGLTSKFIGKTQCRWHFKLLPFWLNTNKIACDFH